MDTDNQGVAAKDMMNLKVKHCEADPICVHLWLNAAFLNHPENDSSTPDEYRPSHGSLNTAHRPRITDY